MTKYKSSAKRETHTLPRLYLRGFSEKESGHLWVFKFGQDYLPGQHGERNNPYRQGIKNVSVVRDAYAYRKPDGKLDYNTFEDGLQKIEQRTDGALKKVRAQEPITKEDKELLAFYVQSILKRVASRRTTLPPISDLVAGLPWQQMVSDGAQDSQFTFVRKVMEAQKYFESSDGGQRLIQLKSMLIPYPRLHADLMSRRWTFYVSPNETFFVTNEYPVIYKGAVGPPYMPFIFPISKEIALVGTYEPGNDLQYQQASHDQAHTINFLVIRDTHETVYSPKPNQWIWEILAQILGLNESQEQFFKQMAPWSKS